MTIDIRKFAKMPKPQEQKGLINNQVPSRNDAGSTNLTDEKKSAMDKGNADELSPDLVSEYLEFLKEHDISQDQIFQVLDSLITNQTIHWSFKLLGRIPVVFSVRPAWVNTLVLERVQENPPKTYAAFNDLVNTFNLAGSLVRYGDQKFAVSSEEEFNKVRHYVQQLPFALKAQLIRQLAIFDRVVAVATSDWAIENFQKPSSEE